MFVIDQVFQMNEEEIRELTYPLELVRQSKHVALEKKKKWNLSQIKNITKISIHFDGFYILF